MDDFKRLRENREEELVLLEELARRQQDDPLRTFQPHHKQKAFVDAVLDGKKECFFFAANRAGKSDAGAFVGATLARFGNQSDDIPWTGAKGSSVQIRDRATSGWVSALDFPTSRDTIQPKYFDNGFVPPGATHAPFIPPREIDEWRVSDQVLKLKNGSIIGFKSAETGRLKYQGSEKDWVQLDEEHPKDIYDEISIRVGARKLRMFTTATILPPEGQVGGVSWMFGSVIQPFLDGTRNDIEVFNASIYDNPFIPEEEIRKLEAKYPEGSLERRIRLNGELLPGLSGSRAYPAFNRLLHVKQQPEIILRRPLCWIWDFNVDPMVTLIGQRETIPGSGKTLFRVFKELIIRGNASIPEMCEYFYQVHPRHAAELWIYGDASGKSRHANVGKSDYTMIANEMRRYRVPTKFKVPETNPPVPDRINALNRVMRDEDQEIRMEIDPSCIELIADLEQVLRDARGGIKKTYNAKDPYSQRTHASDALGYWTFYEEPVQRVRSETAPKVTIMQPTYGRKR